MNELNFNELELLIKTVEHYFNSDNPNNKEWELSEVLMNKLILQMDNAPITIEG